MVGSKQTTKAEDSDESYLRSISVHSGDRTSSVLAARELRAFGQELDKMVSDFPIFSVPVGSFLPGISSSVIVLQKGVNVNSSLADILKAVPDRTDVPVSYILVVLSF